ncbi:Tetratricopeptide TPR_2 [Flavobacteriales bacterium ALC-1]|nr:Tetratricopeptide TPR_2 [Flavobacteriales bacterium ALC-1]
MKTRLLILLSLFSIFIYGQKAKDSLFEIWRNVDLTDSTRANAYNNLISKYYLEKKTDSAYVLAQELLEFTTDIKLESLNADALITLGNVQYIVGDYPSATENYKKSLSIYKANNNRKGEASSLNNIGRIYRANWNSEEALIYYHKSLSISRQIKDTTTMATNLINIGNIYNLKYKPEKSLEYYNESIKLSEISNNQKGVSLALVNIADAYIIKKQYRLAEIKINKAIQIADSLNNHNYLAYAYSTLARNYYQQKKYSQLIKSAEKSLFYAQKTSNKSRLRGAHYFLFEGYRGLKNFDSTFYHYEKRRDYRDDAEQIKSTIALQEMQIDNSKKTDSLLNIEKVLKTKIVYQKEKNKLRLAWGGSLSALSILAFVVYRNTKRKQHKAEKERQQQIEEKEKILKDLELSIIDAMIEGQEKERQRLAADLHDSVGATLSAAKLQFEHLIKDEIDIKVREKLIKKTSTLLEDAYVEIRSMAHLKNSGVMAKNGLLPAVEKLSKNASGINGLFFDVQSFGLEQRLDNALEITIFRIIQELVTNIIKHANATKGIIHITNHKDSLNIMIEDNGIGFNTKQMAKANSGMGISSIDKRIDHLNGTLTIESEKNKGTTVIIDIPI